MCKHTYITKQRVYYDKGYRITWEHDTCIFRGHETGKRPGYMNGPPKWKLPYFGPHLQQPRHKV